MAFSPGAFVSPRSFIKSGNPTVPEIFEWHARENPSVDIFRFHTGHSVERLTYGNLNNAILRAARLVSSFVGSGCRDRHVVGVFAIAESITYLTVLSGVLRAGHVAFPISPRNSTAEVADLLRKTKCTHILVTRDAHITGITQDAFAELDGVSQHAMPQFEDLYPAGASQEDGKVDDTLETPTYDSESPAIILHSSGATNHPKPITWSHRALVVSATGERKTTDWVGTLVGCHGLHMPHFSGSSTIIFAASCGLVLCVFAPAFPPTVPNPENVLEGTIKTGVQWMYSVPSFIETWARDPEKVAAMKEIKGLMFGGGPLNKRVGDTLVAQGVPLVNTYGCTEVGGLVDSTGANRGLDWEYFGISHLIDAYMRPAGDGTYELLVLATSKCVPRVFNDGVNGIDAYATNDLLAPHPTKPGLWKLHGRVDD